MLYLSLPGRNCCLLRPCECKLEMFCPRFSIHPQCVQFYACHYQFSNDKKMSEVLLNLTTSFLSPARSGSFLSGRRNAGWRLWGLGWRHACHQLPQRLLFHVHVHPVAVPVCAADWAQGHLRRPPHLLPVCDLWPALHLPPVDNWAECECPGSGSPAVISETRKVTALQINPDDLWSVLISVMSCNLLSVFKNWVECQTFRCVRSVWLCSLCSCCSFPTPSRTAWKKK